MENVFSRHKFLILMIVLILLRLSYTFCIGIIKPTVIESLLSKNEYIICKEMLVSGAEWVMVQDENQNEVYQYIELNGLENLKNLPRYVDNNNRYIFYFNKKYIGDDYFGKPTLTYDVLDWDIVFPMRRGDRISGILESGIFVTFNDINPNGKRIFCTLIFPIILVTAVRIIYTFFMGIVKRPVRKNKIRGRYILCKYCFRNDDSWMMIQDEYGEEVYQYITFINVDCFENLPKNIDSTNIYIFYIDDKCFDGAKYCYKIFDWDIIYPIKRKNRFWGWLELGSVITRNDI